MKGMKTDSKRKWILIAGVVVVILAVVAAPVWAANNPGSKQAERLAEWLGYPDVAAFRAALGWDEGPKCADSSSFIDADCLGRELGSEGATLGIKSGEDLAAAWGTTEEELEDALKESGGDLEKLAQLLGFDDAKELAAAVGLEEDKLAPAFDSAADETETDKTAAETEETPAETEETPAETEETPAVQNEVEQEAESGEASISANVSNTGDYASQTAPSSQVANTGNFQNQVSVTQSDSVADDIAPEGISAEISPEQAVQSEQEVQQAAAAESSPEEQAAPPSSSP